MPPPVPSSPPPIAPPDDRADPLGDSGQWRLLESTPSLSPAEARAVRRWWSADRRAGESAVAFLVREGILIGRALKELELARKGYLQLSDLSHLFTPGARDRLGALPADTPTEPISPIELLPGAHAVTKALLGDTQTVDVPLISADQQQGPAGALTQEAVVKLAESVARGRSVAPAETPAPAVRQRLPEVGQTLGKCLLTERVGEGGSGVVFRALHQGFNIPVAVKVLRLAGPEADRSQLRHEAQLLAQLNHANVVRVWDFDDAGEVPYLVLEWVDGLSLAELIRNSGRLAADRAVRVVTEVAAALSAAQRLGVVHRDVKPGNVLLTRDGVAKLADLGLALLTRSVVESGEVGGVQIAGTVMYMAPEMFLGRAPDQLSDQYALGVTFFEALTGRPPFRGQNPMEVMIQHAEERPPAPHEVVDGVPPALSAIVLRMLAKDPADRFPHYDELTAALEAALTAEPPPADAAEPFTIRTTATGRSWWRSLFGRRADAGRKAP